MRLWIAWWVLLAMSARGATGEMGRLRETFQQPPAEARIMMRWWWFGPAVTKPELERELQAMKAGGIGGVEIQPVYPLAVDDPEKGIRNLRFLSPEFLDAVRFAADKGRELGLRVDLTLGSGWPYGGPAITQDLAAPRLRVEKTGAEPKLRDGEKVIAEFPDQGVRFIESRTRQMVKRASLGAEGYVLDHYSRRALDQHMEMVGEPMLKAFGPKPPFAIFCDSLEVFGSDWTGDLFAEFQQRRGYDLKPLLPALTGEPDARKGAIRNDWGLTLTELAEERFMKPLQEWAHRHGTKIRMQAYGTPPVTLSSQKYVDLSDGEQPHWKALSPTRWASSANHVMGKTITATETWTWLHSPSFAATPLDMKAEADRHFIQGVNQLIGHGWPYTPPNVEKPGWSLYAAAVFNDSNPWWPAMPDVALYLQRVSWLMRQGKPVSDVALYLPVADIRAHFTAGTGVSLDRQAHEVIGEKVIPRLLEAGFNFDAVDDGLLDQALSQGGYRVVVLPHVERMPVESLKRLEEFVRGGGKLVAVGRTPRLAPGYRNAEQQGSAVRAIAGRLFDGGKGVLVADEEQLGAKLNALLQPDMRWSPASADIGYAHRSVDGAEVYFVANTANVPYKGRLEFKTKGLKAEQWDAATGRTRPFEGGIELPAYGSMVIALSQDAVTVTAKTPDSGRQLDLSSGWFVSFEGTDRKLRMETLRSWTEDAETRFYSGTAVYEKEIEVSRELLSAELDFGEGKPLAIGQRRQSGMRAWYEAPVRDAAVVYVNGKRAGAVWAPPYRLDLTGFVKEGKNVLRVEVSNTSLNLLAQKGEPDYREVTAKYGERFQMQDMKHMTPEPSGLLGRIRLIAR